MQGNSTSFMQFFKGGTTRGEIVCSKISHIQKTESALVRLDWSICFILFRFRASFRKTSNNVFHVLHSR